MSKIKSTKRYIHTNLFTTTATEALESVLGQLSDGWGENNSRNERYWLFAEAKRAADGEAIIEVSTESSEYWGRRYVENAFCKMSDKQVLATFAKFLKHTAMLEIKDSGRLGRGDAWTRDNAEICDYVTRTRENPISFAEVYAIYDALLGRELKKKFSIDVVVKTIGAPRSAKEAKAAKAHAKKRAEIEAKRLDAIMKIADAEANTIAKLEAMIKKIKADSCAKRNAIDARYEKMLAKLAD